MTTIKFFGSSDLSSPSVAPETGIRRDMTRPPHLRQPEYEGQYDFHTLFFDCFRREPGVVHIIAPPFMNFRAYLTAGRISLRGKHGNIHEVKASSLNFRTGRCQVELSFPIPARMIEPELRLELGDLGTFVMPVRTLEADLFRGRRVLLTQFKYDALPWIVDWAQFYADYHGTDSVLLYNNGAANYTNAEIAEALSAVPGLGLVTIVDWDFPFGPQAAGTQRWDSTFCHTGSLQHARRRFLADARSVINMDIDELAVHPKHRSLHEAAEQSEHGYIRMGGIWTGWEQDGDNAMPFVDRRHRHYYHICGKSTDQCPSKWAVVPSACPEDSQWVTHMIHRFGVADVPDGGFSFRHFRHLNNGWKKRRDRQLIPHYEDSLIKDAFGRVGWL